MREASLDAILATLPEDVLLLTGYFPVVGTAVAVATREGAVFLLAPNDELDLAQASGADQVTGFEPGSLDSLTTAAAGIREPLRQVIREAGIASAAVGWRRGEALEPASYVSVHLYGDAIAGLFGDELRDATELFARTKSILTPTELERVRKACRIAGAAFESGRDWLVKGLRETEAAVYFRNPLFVHGTGFEGVQRADGAAFCMSGPNSSKAYGAYARSRSRSIASGDLVLTHCNSHADGYWTDITRTYCMGNPEDRQRRMYEAVFEARKAAILAIRPGIAAREVDRAAREVMRSHGFEKEFKHATGHGLGFCAIDHNGQPRLHPRSEDIIRAGMVFNVEPAAYVEGFGGIRHCDMIAVTASGAELLTDFHSELSELIK
jgi:Xaa-Pro aminopeptidase